MQREWTLNFECRSSCVSTSQTSQDRTSQDRRNIFNSVGTAARYLFNSIRFNSRLHCDGGRVLRVRSRSRPRRSRSSWAATDAGSQASSWVRGFVRPARAVWADRRALPGEMDSNRRTAADASRSWTSLRDEIESDLNTCLYNLWIFEKVTYYIWTSKIILGQSSNCVKKHKRSIIELNILP